MKKKNCLLSLPSSVIADNKAIDFLWTVHCRLWDDCGDNLSFDEVNIYSNKSLRLGTHRVLHTVILPYRMARSSRGYTLYERFDQAEQ